MHQHEPVLARRRRRQAPGGNAAGQAAGRADGQAGLVVALPSQVAALLPTIGRETWAGGSYAVGIVGPRSVAFPAGRFTAAPVVTCNANDSAVSEVWVVNTTASGFDLYFQADANVAPVTLAWIAAPDVDA